jgi:hypothetical protein
VIVKVKKFLGGISEGALKHPILAALALFIMSFILALPFSPSLWANYVAQPTRKFDLDIYLKIATDGYQLPSDPAFYPLWPKLLSPLSGLPEPTFILTANLLSLGFFAASLFALWKLCRRLTSERTAAWITLLFALNPNSIFHALGYPESLFSFLSLMFLWFSLNYLESGKANQLVMLTISATLMSATRPIMAQIGSAGVMAIVIVNLVNRLEYKAAVNTNPRNRTIHWFLATMIGCLIGFIPFGIFCLRKFGNFWQPFIAQNYWDRKFGFHWSLFTAPKSVGGSDNILTWDLQAFYLPPLMLLLFAMTLRAKERDRTWSLFFAVTCLLFAAAHAGIAFLTYPIFMSLGRHVFATPFFFVGAAVWIECVIQDKTRSRMMFWYLVISMIYLIQFWTRYGRSAWLG